MNHASNMTNADSAESETPAELRTLYLAGGCFWGLEAYLKRLPGVRGTVVGYANGSTENPSYHDVCRWNTGHAETVAVTYDPRVLPIFCQWKCMRAGDYALGLEPTAAGVLNRADARRDGVLPMLEAGGSIEYNVALEFLDDPAAIDAYIQRSVKH